MKKIVSLILALVMVFALATTASATTATTNVVGTYHGVDGEGKSLGTIADGADKVGNSFTVVNPANCEVSINVTLTDTINKYAVDVEYDDAALSLGGGVLTWDVNTMTYKTTTEGTEPTQTTKTIKIINYSDLPIQAYATINDSTADGITLTSDYTKDSKLTVEKATPGTGGNNGTATKKDITITLTADTTWKDVVEYYTNLGNTGEVTVATATITVEPVPAP